MESWFIGAGLVEGKTTGGEMAEDGLAIHDLLESGAERVTA